MRFLIISGMSGAGKSQALDVFEDRGFYCVDNMPIALIPKFAELCMAMTDKYNNVALVTDVRGGDDADFTELFSSLDSIRDIGFEYMVLFLDADNSVLINRYKETRRKHPLDQTGIADALDNERRILDPIKKRANYIVNTTTFKPAHLREYLLNLFLERNESELFLVHVVSFGFKYGIPVESDLLFDVRFLPNPYYEPELKNGCGLDKRVQEYVFNDGTAEELLVKMQDLIDYLLPHYIREGKPTLTISIGCTGGRHRSVAMAEKIADKLKHAGYGVSVTHRDMDRGQ